MTRVSSLKTYTRRRRRWMPDGFMDRHDLMANFGMPEKFINVLRDPDRSPLGYAIDEHPFGKRIGYEVAEVVRALDLLITVTKGVATVQGVTWWTPTKAFRSLQLDTGMLKEIRDGQGWAIECWVRTEKAVRQTYLYRLDSLRAIAEAHFKEDQPGEGWKTDRIAANIFGCTPSHIRNLFKGGTFQKYLGTDYRKPRKFRTPDNVGRLRQSGIVHFWLPNVAAWFARPNQETEWPRADGLGFSQSGVQKMKGKPSARLGGEVPKFRNEWVRQGGILRKVCTIHPDHAARLTVGVSEPDDSCSAAEAAARLGVTPSTVRDWCNDHCQWLGRTMRYGRGPIARKGNPIEGIRPYLRDVVLVESRMFANPDGDRSVIVPQSADDRDKWVTANQAGRILGKEPGGMNAYTKGCPILGRPVRHRDGEVRRTKDGSVQPGLHLWKEDLLEIQKRDTRNRQALPFTRQNLAKLIGEKPETVGGWTREPFAEFGRQLETLPITIDGKRYAIVDPRDFNEVLQQRKGYTLAVPDFLRADSPLHCDSAVIYTGKVHVEAEEATAATKSLTVSQPQSTSPVRRKFRWEKLAQIATRIAPDFLDGATISDVQLQSICEEYERDFAGQPMPNGKGVHPSLPRYARQRRRKLNDVRKTAKRREEEKLRG